MQRERQVLVLTVRHDTVLVASSLSSGLVVVPIDDRLGRGSLAQLRHRSVKEMSSSLRARSTMCDRMYQRVAVLTTIEVVTASKLSQQSHGHIIGTAI